MKLTCFAGFWTRRTIGEDQISTSSPWIFSGVDQKVKVLQPQSQNELMAKQQEKIHEDLRGVVESKSDKHRSYFKSLVGTCSSGDQPTIPGNTQMAQPKPVANIAEDGGLNLKINNEGKRQRRLGVYEREAFDDKAQEEIIFKSVKQLRNQYLAMLGDNKIIKKSLEEKPKELPSNLLAPPQSDYASSSGASDDEKTTTWHRKHKVTRCGSSDSAMGQSDDEPQTEFISPYSPRGSIDHSNVPSKIIIQAQTVLCPVDRKSSMDCVSEDNDFVGHNHQSDSRRQSCFTDDGDEAPRYRYWRTPSVVVSDYSDDIMGLTLEDIEYIRSRKEASSSTDSSLHSSCSNLNYCGSTISGLDSEFVLTKPYRKSSNCSTCSTLSGDEDQDTNFESSTANSTLRPAGRPRESSGWRKLRNIVQWTPFFQTYKKHRYPWVQLAGHQGNFKAGPDQGTILKKLCVKEEQCFQILMKDVLRPYVPEYKGLIASDDGESQYIQLQDLLGDFISPCVMDCKVGVRTYLEEELAKAKEKPKLRKDMYEKMCQIDQNAPTEDEHKLKGVTKPRYMVWRETISSTATLGFRIEGVRNADGASSKDFKTTKSKEQIIEAFQNFTDGFPHAVPKYIQRLKAIKATLEQSRFFETHEVIGSSLLFVHDHYTANVWLIDFAKTIKLPSDVSITHNSKWKVGNHEDGYLIGINNLIKIFMTVLENQPISITPPLSLEDPPELMLKVEKEMKEKQAMENT